MMSKTINIIRFFIIACVVVFCSVLKINAQTDCQRQKETVDYVWAVDVSGGSNIYLTDVQQAIDSFYVKASQYGNLSVIRYASSVMCDSTVTDDEFYKHSDQRAMLDAVCKAIENSKKKVVRVFILSDFCNDTPQNGATRLLTDSLLTIRQKFMTMKSGDKNVKLIMLILPPSTSPVGYSLDSIKAIIPDDMYQQFTVNSSDSLQSFIVRETDSLDYQLNCVEEDNKSWIESKTGCVVLISIFLIIAIVVVCYVLYMKKRKSA